MDDPVVDDDAEDAGLSRKSVAPRNASFACTKNMPFKATDDGPMACLEEPGGIVVGSPFGE